MRTFSQGDAAKIKSKQFSEFGSRTTSLTVQSMELLLREEGLFMNISRVDVTKEILGIKIYGVGDVFFPI